MHGRDTIRFLFENPDYEFAYADGKTEVDTIYIACNTFGIAIIQMRFIS
ncbi:MAG: hypothetical protein ACFFCD_13950 [Promethearchaeota archaeon]